MPTESLAAPSTRPLSEVARHLVVPSGIVDTLWFEVEERCREFGDEFDAWQDGLGQLALGVRGDGLFAATVGGVTLSIPRQVAKTFIVMRIVVALCSLYPDLTVVWTAHRTRTATNTFQKMKALVLRPTVKPHIRPGSNRGTAIRDANGEQEIPFANGSRIMFGAREQGFGRGFDEVDIEVFDEAQILTERALEDMVAATNQSRFRHGALLFYMGTPPRPVDPGEVFTQRRSKALDVGRRRELGEVVEFDALYVECSADPDVARRNPDDREQWGLANPSYPDRTPLASLLRLRENLPNDDSWLREALGVWDEVQAGLFDMSKWASLVLPREDARPSPVALAVSVSSDRQWAHVGLAGVRSDGKRHLQVVRSGRGTDWVAGSVEELVGLWSPVGVGVDPTSPAGSLIPALEEVNAPVVLVQGRERGQAVGLFLDGFAEGTVCHQGETVLGMSVEHARLRDSGESKVWDHRVEGVDVAPLQSVTNALFVLTTVKPRKAGSGRVVVLS